MLFQIHHTRGDPLHWLDEESDMSNDGLHKPRPLDLTPGYIRLLRVLPDLSNDGHIQCQIWNETTDAQYSCLSYTWGSEHAKKDILIDGRTFKCRKNLWDFLDIARGKASLITGAFWIDAICIDQLNVFERNHQVSQMGNIYSSAASVLIWLGRDAAIARFLSFIQDMVDTLPDNYDIKVLRTY